LIFLVVFLTWIGEVCVPRFGGICNEVSKIGIGIVVVIIAHFAVILFGNIVVAVTVVVLKNE
jgi:hypothetical protein